MSPTPTWLVTGAHGFLGANAGAWLSGRAHRIGAVRGAASDTDLFDEWVSADLTAPGPLTDFVLARRPDVILHPAAIAYHDRCEDDPALARRVNVEATAQLARAAEQAGSRFVVISTDAVFDGSRGLYSEDDPVNPTSVYGQTKVDAERAALAATDAIVVRTNFFGWSPTGQRSILEFFVNALSEGRHVRGFTDFTTSSAYAQVLLDVVWRLVAMDATGTFHVTSPDRMTKYEFGVTVAEVFGLDAALISPARADIHPPRDGDISLDVSKAQGILGRQLPTMREGVELARADRESLRLLLRSAHAE